MPPANVRATGRTVRRRPYHTLAPGQAVDAHIGEAAYHAAYDKDHNRPEARRKRQEKVGVEPGGEHSRVTMAGRRKHVPTALAALPPLAPLCPTRSRAPQ